MATRLGPAATPITSYALLMGLGATAMGGTALAQETEALFARNGCHVAFAYPRDWEVVPDSADPQDPCRFSVRPRDWQRRLAAHDSVDLFTVLVRIIPQGVWEHVAYSGFQRRGPGWVILGHQDLEEPADTISGPGWSGLRGTATQGCYRVEGEYAGLCDQPTALVGTPSRSVMLVGGPRSEDVFDRMLASLRFQ